MESTAIEESSDMSDGDSTIEESPEIIGDENLSSEKPRRKFKCPHCPAKVANLPRHARDMHSYQENEAHFMTLGLNIRVKRSKVQAENLKHKNYHKAKKCPAKDCSAVAQRVKRHLATCHKDLSPLEQLALLGSAPPSDASLPDPPTSSQTSSSVQLSGAHRTARKIARTYPENRRESPMQLPLLGLASPSAASLPDLPSSSSSRTPQPSSSVRLSRPHRSKRQTAKACHVYSSGSSCDDSDLDASYNPRLDPDYDGNDLNDNDLEDNDLADDYLDDNDLYNNDHHVNDHHVNDHHVNDHHDLLPTPPPFKIVLKKFASYLASPMGEILNPATIQQRIGQIETFKKYLQSNNYRKLFNKVTVSKIVQKLAMKKCEGGKGLKYETIRQYLSAFKQLLTFLKSDNTVDPHLNPMDLERLITELARQSKGLKKQCRREHFDRQERDVQQRPKCKDIRLYLNSKLREQVIDKIMSTNSGQPFTLSIREKKFINGLLFLETSLDNANRAGEVRNLTLIHFGNAVMNRDGGCTLKVREHKTRDDYGSTNLQLDQKLMELFHVYKSKIRPLLLCEQSPNNFFLTVQGKALTSMSIPRDMQYFWNSLGLKTVAGPTLLRKSVVTTIHQHHPEMKAALASQMNHTEKTATEHYLTMDKEMNSRKVTKVLRKMLIERDSDVESEFGVDEEQVVKRKKGCGVNGGEMHVEAGDRDAGVEGDGDAGVEDDVDAVVEGGGNAGVEGDRADTGVDGHGDVGMECVGGTSMKMNAERGAHVDDLFEEQKLIETDDPLWSPRNLFTREETEHLSSSCRHLLVIGRKIYRVDVLKILNESRIGRKMVREQGFAKIKNKLNHLKY